MIGILAAIAIPAYQDYINRAKVAGGLAQAKVAEAAVEGYAYKNQHWPSTNADVGLAKGQGSDGKGIKAIVVRPNGVVVVAFTGGALEGKGLVLTPYVEKGKIGWQCQGYEVPAKYLPTGCR